MRIEISNSGNHEKVISIRFDRHDLANEKIAELDGILLAKKPYFEKLVEFFVNIELAAVSSKNIEIVKK